MRLPVDTPEVHLLTTQQRSNDLHVLLGVAAGMGIGESVLTLNQWLVRRSEAQRDAAADRVGDRRDPVGLKDRVTRERLENRRSQFERRRLPARDRHGDQRIALDDAPEPQRREALGFGRPSLSDDALDGRGGCGQPDAHYFSSSITMSNPTISRPASCHRSGNPSSPTKLIASVANGDDPDRARWRTALLARAVNSAVTTPEP